MSEQSQQLPFGSRRSARPTGSSSRVRRPSTGSPEVEAELAAIFGEDEMLRHPPDPFEEKILTGRNSFNDLRDQLAQEEDDVPRPRPSVSRPRPASTTSRTPSPRSRVSPTESKIAELRRDLAEGGSTRTPARSDSRFFHDTPAESPRPSSSVTRSPSTRPAASRPSEPEPDERLASLRRELAERRTAASATTAPSTPRARVAPTPAPVTRRPRVEYDEDIEAPVPERVPARTTRRPVEKQPPARVPAALVDDLDDLFEPEEELAPPPVQRRPATRKPRIEFEEPEPAGPSFEEPDDFDVAFDDEEPPAPAPVVKQQPKRRPTQATPPKVAVQEPTRKPNAATGEVAHVSKVTKVYGDSSGRVEVLRGVNLVIGKGQLTVILGPSGSGKSTLLRCMAGLETPSAGVISVDGQTISSLKENALAKFRRSSVGMVFSDLNLLPSLTTAENIRLPITLRKTSLDSGWYDQVVTTLHLSEILTHKPLDLSPAQAQRVAFARALMGKPAIIFADEPTDSLSSQAAQEITALLSECVDTLGQSIVVATRDPGVAASADRICVMNDGQILSEITTPSLSRAMDALASLAGEASA